ncbi:MAG: CpaF family protein, partial [Pseudomonadota bacterium]
MFSKYKKSQAAPGPVAAAAAAAPVPEAAPTVTRRAAPQKAAAQAAPADKERKRKERMGEIKLELHRVLLDNLNLAALETATEADLRREIGAISAEFLQERSV